MIVYLLLNFFKFLLSSYIFVKKVRVSTPDSLEYERFQISMPMLLNGLNDEAV